MSVEFKPSRIVLMYKHAWLWSAGALLLFFGLLLFWKLTDIGMDGCDPFTFYSHAKCWLHGYYFNYHNKIGYILLIYVLNALIGLNDFNPNLVAAGAGYLSLCLVVVCLLVGQTNRWLALCGGVLLGSFPIFLYYSRFPLSNTTSVCAVLVSFAMLMVGCKNGGLRILTYFIAGVFATYAGLSHSIALLYVPIVGCIIVADHFAINRMKHWRDLFANTFSYGLGSLLPVFIFAWLFSLNPDDSRSLWEIIKQSIYGRLVFASGVAETHALGLSRLDSIHASWTVYTGLVGTYLLYPIAIGLLLVFSIWIFQAVKKGTIPSSGVLKLRFISYLAASISLFIVIYGYTGQLATPRYYLSLLPLSIILLTFIISFVFSNFKCEHVSPLVLFVVFVCVLNSNDPMFAGWRSTYEVSPYKATSNVLSRRVDADNRLAVLPSTAYNMLDFWGFYFIEPTFHFRPDWTPESATKAVSDYSIRYIAVSKRYADENFFFHRDVFGEIPSGYSVSDEYDRIKMWLKSVDALLLYKSAMVDIYIIQNRPNSPLAIANSDLRVKYISIPDSPLTVGPQLCYAYDETPMLMSWYHQHTEYQK